MSGRVLLCLVVEKLSLCFALARKSVRVSVPGYFGGT